MSKSKKNVFDEDDEFNSNSDDDDSPPEVYQVPRLRNRANIKPAKGPVLIPYNSEDESEDDDWEESDDEDVQEKFSNVNARNTTANKSTIRRSRRGQKNVNLATYVCRLVKVIQPKMSIASSSKAFLADCASKISENILERALTIMRTSSVGEKTLTHKQIETACKVKLPESFVQPCISSINIAVLTYGGANSNTVVYDSDRSLTRRLRLTISVSRVEALIRLFAPRCRVSKTAAIALTSVIEYLLSRIIMAAISVATLANRKTIGTSHIQTSLKDPRNESIKLLLRM